MIKTLNYKTIPDAAQYMQSLSIEISKSVITYIIGSTDLEGCSAQEAANICKRLLRDSKVKFRDSQIVLYGIPPRKPSPRWPGYEGKRHKYNFTMEKFCQKNDDLYFAKSSVAINQIKDDKIHLRHKEVRTIVTDLKKTINPLMGLKPYREYTQTCLGDGSRAT